MLFYSVIELLLLMGFGALFYQMISEKRFQEIYRTTKLYMEKSARQRLLLQRENLRMLREEKSIWNTLEKQLYYTGLKRKIPFITLEAVLLMQGLLMAGVFLGVCVFTGISRALSAVMGLLFAEWIAVTFLKMREKRKANEGLMKLLDFLGNYSIVSGELTAVLQDTGKYMEEPIRSVIALCCNEAQTTGDLHTAMRTMSERIDHPQFRELIRNMEISSRYCADLKPLVNSSRRSLREYLRLQREKRGILTEACIDMAILTGMALVSLTTVNYLTDISVYQLLFTTWPGRIALAGFGVILCLFLRQLIHLID